MAFELSICIPTLNRADYIGETLDSIVAQLQPCVEIVIVDGGSTDGSDRVVAEYVKRYPQIRYVRTGEDTKASNAGFDRDCSRAVELASGTHCWLMTDDDVIKPNAIACILEAIREGHDVAIVSCEVRDIHLKKQLLRARPAVARNIVYGPADWDKFFLVVISHATFVGCLVIRRSLWIERRPENFFGSGFVHVGVLFRSPIEGTSIILAEPLVVIRNGNGQWTSRAFDIVMRQWPKLVWSFEGVSDAAKKVATPREPWRMLSALLLQRAYGQYSMREFETVRNDMGTNWKRIPARIIAILPLRVLYWPARVYGHFRHADTRLFIETLDNAISNDASRRG